MIAVVQGDVWEAHISLKGVDEDALLGITLASERLNLKVEAEFDELEGYYFRIPGEITRTFKVGLHPYQITLSLIDGEVFTIRPKDFLEVLRKPEVTNAGAKTRSRYKA